MRQHLLLLTLSASLHQQSTAGDMAEPTASSSTMLSR